MARKPIHAAGGIVVLGQERPLIAVVQRAKDDRWVLPRGKLKVDEHAWAGARREVMEETGHHVTVGKFLGAITYRAQGRPKLVQYWHMKAAASPSRDLMKDITAVAWLPLPDAVRRLSYPLEKLFLKGVGTPLVRDGGRSKAKPKMKRRQQEAKAARKRR